jgi:FlaA1/EpsC-like NDP-sugar epimerase
MVLGAIGAKIIYLDLFLHQPLPIAEYFGAGILAGIVASTIARELDLNSSSQIIAGELRARDIFATVGLSFVFLLVLFYLLKVSDHYSRGWLLLWFLLSTAILLAERAGILLWARLLRAEHRLLQRVALYGEVQLALRAADRICASDPNSYWPACSAIMSRSATRCKAVSSPGTRRRSFELLKPELVTGSSLLFHLRSMRESLML